MEIWYKTGRYSVNAESAGRLQEDLMAILMPLRKMALANLQEDQEYFYVKTSNSIPLQDFLYKHGFNQVEKPGRELNVISGI